MVISRSIIETIMPATRCALLGVLALTHMLISGVSAATPGKLPSDRLVSGSDLEYLGAFSFPADELGESSVNWAAGALHIDDQSIFIAGHVHDDAIAEFTLPDLVNTVELSELNYAVAKQPFSKLLDNRRVNNRENLDLILGIEKHRGRLIVNAMEYYDAAGDNRLSTVVVANASNLAQSNVSGLHGMQGKARAAGWLSAVPKAWQPFIGGTHISGSSSGLPIISRLSVGPSAFALNLDDALSAEKTTYFSTRELLGFSYDRPLHDDLFNKFGRNRVWTHVSEAHYGFILPDSRSYVTLGFSGGHEGGVEYKPVRDDGEQCGGYCSTRINDNYNYYWLWDVADMLAVKRGEKAPHEIKPYEHGKLNLPFQGKDGFRPVGGASYDPLTEILYILVQRANDSFGKYANPPVVVAYRFKAAP